MPEINYQDLEKFLKETGENGFPPVALLYGEEFLYKTAFKTLCGTQVPEARSGLNHEIFDGSNDNVPLALEAISTFSLFSDEKIVIIQDSRIFYSKQDGDLLLQKARQAYDEENIDGSARYFLNYLDLLNLKPEDLSQGNRDGLLIPDLSDLDDNEWIRAVIDHCVSNRYTVSSSGDYGERLAKAIEKGFPGKNRLIITTELVDKRRLLYKTIREIGLIVDCSVPKGQRKADTDQQNAVLTENLRKILSRHGKTMEPAAYEALVAKTGFDLRTFTGNIEKLVDFVGAGSRIREQDVASVLDRTKIDPIFELTNALSDRNPEKSLFYVESLLSADLHPLQIIAAMVNQVRKLLLCREFIENLDSSTWRSNISFNEFKSKIIPLLVDRDKLLLEELARWDKLLNPEDESPKDGKPKKSRKSEKSISSDILMAKNPQNAYPIYQLMLKSALFSIRELTDAMELLGRADRMLKTSGTDPKTMLEKTVVAICSQIHAKFSHRRRT
jgi:DNA polymerase-3 subunit delta